LNQKSQIDLVKIFTPEHGLRTMQDSLIDDSIDPKTGLEVISLYKAGNRAPRPKQLKNIDVLIFDLQDVGVRFYTYHTTLARTLEATKNLPIDIIVLDRANPMGGKRVEGAVLGKKLLGGFSHYYPMTTVHGMTMGELAKLFNKHYKINHPRLKIIPLKNWTRNTLWEDMDYPWITPSPALPTLEQTYLYSTFGGNLAGLNLAVGRGVKNHLAFTVYGAPFITDQQAFDLANDLNSYKLPGLSFYSTSWKVTRREYLDQTCFGIRVKLDDIKKVDGLKTTLVILKEFINRFPRDIKYRRLDIRLGTKEYIKMLENDVSIEKIIKRMNKSQKIFLEQRKDSLIYK
jgi:uncharacterized protein YbbC (DUF1343 family)